MFHLDHRVVRAIHADRIPRDLDARVALAAAMADAKAEARDDDQPGRANRLRRAVGRSLVAAGSRLAAEPPPRPARTR